MANAWRWETASQPEALTAGHREAAVRQEARLLAESIYNDLREVVERAADRIRHAHGRAMLELVMVELVTMESNVPAASLLTD
jgi:hypothetical protein